MERGYKHVVWLFVAVTLLVFAGFFKTYFVRLNSPGQFSAVHHIHGVIMIIWLALLIVQPILISKGKLKLHRRLGAASYFIMPALIFLMLLAYKGQYLRGEANGDPHSQNLALLLIPVTDTLPFGLLYILAMFYRKRREYHMRYIIANALVLIGPPLGRLMMVNGFTDFVVTILITYIVTDVLLVGLALYDRSQRKSFPLNPYWVSAILLLVCQTTLLYLPMTDLWQHTAQAIVDNF